MAARYVVGDSMSPFLKRVLIPFWVIRIIIMVLNIIAYSIIIAATARVEENRSGRFSNVGTLIGLLVVVLLLIAICLVLDIVCIVKRARRTLTPKFFCIVTTVQTTFWTALFIMSMLGANTAFSFIASIIIYLSFVGVLIYAGVIFHRHRKGTLQTRYAPAATGPVATGPVATGPADRQGLTSNTAYNNTAYKPYVADPASPYRSVGSSHVELSSQSPSIQKAHDESAQHELPSYGDRNV